MKRTFFFLFILTLCIYSSGEELFRVNYEVGDKYKITEISNLRIRENGKYIGFRYRQVRGVLDVVPEARGGSKVKGDFYVFEETKRDTRLVANQVDRVVYTEFQILPNGQYLVPPSNPFPALRDFPTFPKEPLKKGDKWKAYGTRIIEPFHDGVYTKVRFYCEYTYNGLTEFKGGQFHSIQARFALRYKAGDDPDGDKRIREITNAGHSVNILFNKRTGKPVFMNDTILEAGGGEVYKLADGTTIVVKGFTHIWFDTIEPMDRDKIVENIRQDLKEEPKKDDIKTDDIPDTTIEKRDEGVALTLNKIRFVANKDIILPEEKGRLNKIAETLKKIKGRTFLVIGHTAKAGTTEEQYELSVRRAKAIVDHMVSQGMEEKQFLYQGKGATEPVAPNDTEENMAKNRRVEIIIMED
ncbi:MAG: OmpA family protein [Spirochaetales bacterium]|nr:OmpA family protein [Spirochaetales bacterium]